jgi:glyoxylase-like metal-dependent hydrolase (beta-lactamase superfamily II)
MAKPRKIWEKVYQIGGSDISHGQDCCVYIVDVGNAECVLIDCGAGKSFDTLVKNIKKVGLDPEGLKSLILTHCHIDHIGAARLFKDQFNCQIIAHEKGAEAIEGRDLIKTAAQWYGVDYSPVEIDIKLTGDFEKLNIGDVEFNCIHTPGHTPGSISVYCDIMGKRVLFGQDIHGPFDESFGSNIEDWKKSMQKLLDIEADILCEGHFGIYQPKEEVKRYIESYLRRY